MEGDEDNSSEGLVSKERMVSASPVMWPDQNFCELITFYSVHIHAKVENILITQSLSRLNTQCNVRLQLAFL